MQPDGILREREGIDQLDCLSGCDWRDVVHNKALKSFVAIDVLLECLFEPKRSSNAIFQESERFSSKQAYRRKDLRGIGLDTNVTLTSDSC